MINSKKNLILIIILFSNTLLASWKKYYDTGKKIAKISALPIFSIYYGVSMKAAFRAVFEIANHGAYDESLANDVEFNDLLEEKKGLETEISSLQEYTEINEEENTKLIKDNRFGQERF